MSRGREGSTYTPIALIFFTVVLLYLAASTLSSGQTRSFEVVVPILNVERGTYTFSSITPPHPFKNITRTETASTSYTRPRPLPPGPLERLLELIAGLLYRLLKLISEALSRALVNPIEAPEIREETEPSIVYASPEHVMIILGIASTLTVIAYFMSRRRKRRVLLRRLRLPMQPERREGEAESANTAEEPPIDLSKLRNVRDPVVAVLESFRIIYALALRKLKASESYTHREIASLYERVSLGREARTIANAFEAVRFAGRRPEVRVEDVLTAVSRILRRVGGK